MLSADDVKGAVTERILVVDDEPDIVALVAYHLARAAYGVSTAATGLDARLTALGASK
jgi:DNA-binding response OmpR family regulator